MRVVISTHQWPEALDIVLAALAEQPGIAEIVVADDGSGRSTLEVVTRWQAKYGEALKYVWQQDAGFRKARVLNLGALAATGDYLLFLDGDCVPRRGFLAAVRRAAIPGWFVAGKRLAMSEELSRRVLEERLPVWRWSALHWFLRVPAEFASAPSDARRRPGLLLPIRDRRRPWRPGQSEFRPPYGGYGSPFGVAREDFERINGFDMRFVGWGGEDVDTALRLRRAGVRCGWPGAQATMLHLWHPTRKGRTPSNAALRKATAESTRIEAVEGLRELAREIAA